MNNDAMLRPCFLVVDREFSTGISTRKLVIETAKFNVITAYSAAEAVQTLKTFPAVNAAVIDEQLEDTSCAEFIRQLKSIKPDLVVVVVGDRVQCAGADSHVESFQPEKLLERLRQLQPAETDAIAKINRELQSLENTP